MPATIHQINNQYTCPHNCGYTHSKRRSVIGHLAHCPNKPAKTDPSVATPPPSLRPGKKSIPWRDDPDIMQRLLLVEDYILAGSRNTEVAKLLKIAEGTVRNDRKRIAELWQDEVASEIAAMRQRSIAQMRRLQRQGEKHYTMLEKDLAALRLQMDAEKVIIQLEGTTTPIEQTLKVKGERPIEAMSSAELLRRAELIEQMARQLLEKPADSAPDP